MASYLLALCFSANEPRRLARFWADVLGWETADDPPDGVALLPSDDTGFRIRFLPARERKAGRNQMHFDLTSTSPENQQQTVARSLGLGARHIDVGQRPEEGHVVLADPEKSRLHFDLAPTGPADRQAEVDRLVSIGATRVDIGEGEAGSAMLADPDGNEFRLVGPR